MSLLDKDTIKKGRVNNALPELKKKFEAKDNKEYKVKAIIDSVVYNKKTSNQMPGLDYLVLWKNYHKEISTWELLTAVMHLRKLINTFYKNYL